MTQALRGDETDEAGWAFRTGDRLVRVLFAEPNRLPEPSRLGQGVVVLDIAFALPLVPADWPLRDSRSRDWVERRVEETTLNFIRELGKRLVLWIDHHQHEAWRGWQGDDPRFLLDAEAASCAQLVEPPVVEIRSSGRVDTVVCHGDLDGLLSAARFLRGGAWPYPGAEEDARAADTRRGTLGPEGSLADRALRSRPDDRTRVAVLSWLLAGAAGARPQVAEAADGFCDLASASRILLEQRRLVGACQIVDARDAPRRFEMTELLLGLEGRSDAGIVLFEEEGRERIAVGCAVPGADLPRWLGLAGGSRQRVLLEGGHLDEVAVCLDEELGAETPPQQPREALVEIVRRCNLHCPLCPAGNGLARPMPDMPESTYRRVVEAFAGSLEQMALHNYGEPLLHPQVAAFVRLAKQAGVPEVSLTTNGNYLPPALAEALVASGLDRIRFSVDGIDPAAYEEYRLGGRLQDVLASIERLRRTREALGARRPLIEAQAMLMRGTEDAAPGFARTLRSVGADRVRAKTLNVFMSGEDLLERGLALLPLDPDRRRYAEAHPRPARHRREMRLCRWPWRKLVVLADGTVVPCCHDYDGSHPLGQAGAEGRLIWDSPERRRFMLRRIARPESIEMCRRCSSAVPRLGLQRTVDLERTAEPVAEDA